MANQKFSIDSGDGRVITVTPEHLIIVDNGGKETILCVKTEHTLIPITFFKALLASPDEIKAREAAKKAPEPTK